MEITWEKVSMKHFNKYPGSTSLPAISQWQFYPLTSNAFVPPKSTYFLTARHFSNPSEGVYIFLSLFCNMQAEESGSRPQSCELSGWHRQTGLSWQVSWGSLSSPHHTQGTVIHCNVLGEAAFKDSGWDSCYQRTLGGLSTGPSRIFCHHLLPRDLGWGNVLSLTRLSFTPSSLTLLSLWALGP